MDFVISYISHLLEDPLLYKETLKNKFNSKILSDI